MTLEEEIMDMQKRRIEIQQELMELRKTFLMIRQPFDDQEEQIRKERDKALKTTTDLEYKLQSESSELEDRVEEKQKLLSISVGGPRPRNKQEFLQWVQQYGTCITQSYMSMNVSMRAPKMRGLKVYAVRHNTYPDEKVYVAWDRKQVIGWMLTTGGGWNSPHVEGLVGGKPFIIREQGVSGDRLTRIEGYLSSPVHGWKKALELYLLKKEVTFD